MFSCFVFNIWLDPIPDMILNNMLVNQNETEQEQDEDHESSEETHVDEQVLQVRIRSEHSGPDTKFIRIMNSPDPDSVF